MRRLRHQFCNSLLPFPPRTFDLVIRSVKSSSRCSRKHHRHQQTNKEKFQDQYDIVYNIYYITIYYICKAFLHKFHWPWNQTKHFLIILWYHIVATEVLGLCADNLITDISRAFLSEKANVLLFVSSNIFWNWHHPYKGAQLDIYVILCNIWNQHSRTSESQLFKYISSKKNKKHFYLIPPKVPLLDSLCLSVTMISARYASAFGNMLQHLGVPSRTKSVVFFNIVQRGGGVKPMFKNFWADFV